MMKILKKLFGALYHTLFGVYKYHTVVEVVQDEFNLSTVFVKTINGTSITLNCKKFNYVIENHSVWVPDYSFINYEISGTCEGDTSDKLREALARVVYFPPIGKVFASEHGRRKFLIEAYIDLLTSDLEKHKF